VVSSRSPTLSSSIHSHTSGTGRESIFALALLSASERALICIHPSAQIFKSAIISSSSSSHRRFIFLITTMTYSAGGAGGDECEREAERKTPFGRMAERRRRTAHGCQPPCLAFVS